MYEWDEAKRQTNLAKHGIDFLAIAGFDWVTAARQADNRQDYGEARMAATGRIGERLYFVVYVQRGSILRIISLRKANTREATTWLSKET